MYVYDHSGLCVSPPFNIHRNSQLFLTILVAVMFGTEPCVGFDPTITVTPTQVIQVPQRQVVNGTMGVNAEC